MDRAVRGEELGGLVHAHAEHLADALSLESHHQGLGREALAAARLARDLHVRKEAHPDGLDTLALACVAAAPSGVERETPRTIAADARLAAVCEQLADRIPEADVGGGAGPWRLADRRLVH